VINIVVADGTVNETSVSPAFIRKAISLGRIS
jgi:hypothetical protein